MFNWIKLYRADDHHLIYFNEKTRTFKKVLNKKSKKIDTKKFISITFIGMIMIRFFMNYIKNIKNIYIFLIFCLLLTIVISLYNRKKQTIKIEKSEDTFLNVDNLDENMKEIDIITDNDEGILFLFLLCGIIALIEFIFSHIITGTNILGILCIYIFIYYFIETNFIKRSRIVRNLKKYIRELEKE